MDWRVETPNSYCRTSKLTEEKFGKLRSAFLLNNAVCADRRMLIVLSGILHEKFGNYRSTFPILFYVALMYFLPKPTVPSGLALGDVLWPGSSSQNQLQLIIDTIGWGIINKYNLRLLIVIKLFFFYTLK